MFISANVFRLKKVDWYEIFSLGCGKRIKGGVPFALVVLGTNEEDVCLPLQRSLVAVNFGPESRFNQCDPRNSDKIDEGFGVR